MFDFGTDQLLLSAGVSIVQRELAVASLQWLLMSANMATNVNERANSGSMKTLAISQHQGYLFHELLSVPLEYDNCCAVRGGDLDSCFPGAIRCCGNVHIRPSGKVAVTIYSVADLEGLAIYFVIQLMEITGFVHPRQALLQRPELLPICSLL